MLLKVDHLRAAIVGLEGKNSIRLSCKSSKEDMWRRGVERNKLTFSAGIGRVNSTFKMLCLSIPGKFGNIRHHLWKHIIVPASAFKWTQFLRPTLAHRKHFVLHLFFSNCRQKPTPKKGPSSLATFCRLTQNCNDCNTKQGYRFKKFASGQGR